MTIFALANLNALGETSRVIAGQRLTIPPMPDIESPAMPEQVAPAAFVPPPPSAPPPPQVPEWFAGPASVAPSSPPPMYVPPPQQSAPSYNPQPSNVQKSAPAPMPQQVAQQAAAAPRPAPPRPPRPAGGTSPLDPRLAALNIRIEPAQARQGESYWKLLRAEYQDPTQSNGNHHMLYLLLDDKGKPVLVQRVFQGLADIQADSFTDAFGRAKIPMWENYNPEHGDIGPYSAWVAGLPSDKVIGLGMPNGLAVNFVLTWQKTIK